MAVAECLQSCETSRLFGFFCKYRDMNSITEKIFAKTQICD